MVNLCEGNIQMLLTDYYRDCFQIRDEALLADLIAVSRIKTFQAGERLFKQGEVPSQLCLLMQGVVRGFVLSENGKDITDCISFRCGECAMPDNEIWRPASINVEALEDCQVVCIDMDDVQQLLRSHPELIRVQQQLLLYESRQHRELKIMAYQCTAAQRYQWFLEQYPGLIDRVQHKYIASLLNMTPVTLSKIRRELKERIRV